MEPYSPVPNPTWSDFFSDDRFDEFVRLLKIDSADAKGYLKATLPWAVERCLRVWNREHLPGLAERRRAIETIERQARRLRESLLGLEGQASIDFKVTAIRYTGADFTIEPTDPENWASQAALYARDVSVVARAAAADLKRNAKPGGRPKKAAVRILIDDLALIYERAAHRVPGRRGIFPRFVILAGESILFPIAEQGLDQMLREVLKERSKLV